jgi:hypothetical protein
MGYRRFADRQGRTWEVRERSRSEWELHATEGPPQKPIVVSAPGYEKDPFELSVEELQRMVDEAGAPSGRPRKKSPFGD